ncbi:superfamily II DNA or RNA helicase [Nonomuraea muscovyensis]|uniref:Superfamily II DNA or RNA helicase n=1 Tax=Nonomuraea muscovyensis TaxID=1124761 RepID=A0A7X0BZ36_9ACTN|nr:DEAD/DEAH box helicase [Nonomuraea muscovyensis]MBB6345248.1 superfamily II DNA or RNA helicase [Nonomuraea muscovyensis]
MVRNQSARVLETYRIDPGLIQEHANNERRIKEGGYGDRQIYELVQNGADELRDNPGGQIAVVLTTSHLYCANQGSAITPDGADTILRMGVSRKRGGQIGRFGVGVKSVLSVTDVPEFFSAEDDKSFGFDRDWAAERIRTVQPTAAETPVLRMARPLDRDAAAAADPILAELLGWATTVVRLPLKPTAVNRLGRDLTEFPQEFALFSAHVGTVTLQDRRTSKPVVRQISHRAQNGLHDLQVERSGKKAAVDSWRVFSRTHRPSAQALAEAGELHDRPEIDVSWAVPVGRMEGRGRFWAFFPTNYETTLRGIINAPWKTSEDRQNLYNNNSFNHELIKVAAELIVDSLPELSREDDPCAGLDPLPARGKEEPQWAATELVRSIWSAAANRPTIPDQDGVFGTVSTVHLHPDKLRPEWLELWAGHPGRPRNWCHHSVDSGQYRRDKVGYIQAAAGVITRNAKEWLEALLEDKSPQASARAIKIAAEMRRHGHPGATDALKARIVLTESFGLVAPSGRVFRRSGSDGLADNTVYVDERVYAGDPATVLALNELGVHEADYQGRFASVVEQGFSSYSDKDWASFWELSRLAGPAGTLTALKSADIKTEEELKVRTVSGGFRRIRECLLPGRVVPADGSRDAHIAVDVDFHHDDRVILRDLGLLDGPKSGVDPRSEPWFTRYTQTLWEGYCRKLPPSEHRPMHTTMNFDGSSPAGPLEFLCELSEEGRAAFLQQLPDNGLVHHWTMQVGKQVATRKTVVSPLRWMARKHGYLETSRGLKPVTQAVGPELRRYEHVLPVARVSPAVSNMLGLPHALGEVKASTWAQLIEEAATSTDDAFAGRVYALIFEADAQWPEGGETRCRLGSGWRTDIPDGEIAVTADRTQYEALVREQIPALLAPSAEAAGLMREHWRMLAPDDVIQKELRWVEQSEAVPLTDEFPHLKIVKRAQTEGWSLVRCDELEEVIRTPHGARAEVLPSAVQTEERKVLVLRPANDEATLAEIDKVLKLGLGPGGCRGVLERRRQQRNNERIKKAREATDVADKVLHLVGVDALKKGLPQGLLEIDEVERGRPADDRRIATLAHNAHGTDLLRVYRKDIEANLPEAAASFRGDTNSVRLVNDLGLSESYAGTRGETLPPVERVSGPTAFPRLHDYQERLAQKTFDLLTRWEAPRAMLCLPTGAGKTRVAAEAIIRVIKERGLDGKPVLWIAQSEELCEQAVQSWAFVWSKVGPAEQLTINRLWSSREAAANKETVHLVVATDAKLESCLVKPEYGWLRDAALVVIDEAHFSITPRYTDLLKSLGITHRESSRPLIGLTATPYRGFNEIETNRLVERYGRTRLDEGIFGGDPYAELQELGVLARVEHRELKGATIELSEEELKATSGFQRGRLPASVEESLGQDTDRNNMLIREIEALPVDSPVLLFATSVNHAKLMAALLRGRGISAAAIDSATPDSDRRARIEEFRTRKIRVLTNYGVLAQGFDAPATEVVIVARPTYSPNVYQQMIGRGLRGPLNGGKETCLILDVTDNIVNYDKKLAFTGFEYLWSRR